MKKSYFKATTLGVRMCSTELQKDLARYPMALYKRDSTTDIFFGIFKFFSDKLFHKTTPNH